MKYILYIIFGFTLISCSGVKKAENITILNISQKEYAAVKEANYSKNDLESMEGKNVKFIGILRLVNSEPMTDWVVTLNSQIDIYIADETKNKKFNYLPNQGKFVEINGKLIVKKLVYENPVYNHNMYYILINNDQ